MTFPLFQKPKTWPQWLKIAIEAEKICISRGMKKDEIKKLLLKQSNDKIYDFTKNFLKKKERNIPSLEMLYSARYGTFGHKQKQTMTSTTLTPKMIHK